MEKILFFILLSFSFLAYASPPTLTDLTANDIQFVTHYDAPVFQSVAVQNIAFVSIANPDFVMCSYKSNKHFDMAFLSPGNPGDTPCFKCNLAKKPPALQFNLLTECSFQPDMQNTNYGYPFGADFHS